MPRFSVKLALCIFALIAGTLTVLVGRAGYLQTYKREKIIRSAERQQHQTETLYARRGSIFDCNGMLMAGTVQTTALFIDPKFMFEQFEAEELSPQKINETVSKLAYIIDVPAKDLHQILDDRHESRYVKIAEHLSDEAVNEILKMDLPGVGFTPQSERYYPMGALAAHILGGVQKDNVGLEGVELKFDKLLAGKDGFKRSIKDGRRRELWTAAEDYMPPQNGQHLVLTIDANIQMIVEQELENVCKSYNAKEGEAVVMDPKTGAVLALANWPNFNPQNLDDSTKEVRTNRAIVVPYEPGSTIKPFIVGPALAWKVSRPDEVFHTGGKVWHTSYGRKIEDVHGYDKLALWDVLVKSSNIGMSMLGGRLGNGRLHQALDGFHFGDRTGIELPGENGGLLNALPKWTRYSTESVSQGYELMVTPLQLARGFCAYANGGRLVTPRLIKGALDENGQVVARYESEDLAKMPEVVEPTTSALMRRIMCDTLVRGTAKTARSNLWNIFGKTGTAHVSLKGQRGYSDDKYTSSFIGGAPYENPRLVIAFVVHEPDKEKALSENKSYYGGAVAAPGASKALERSLAYLQVPASPDLPLPPQNIQNVLYDFSPKVYERKIQTASVPGNR
jgi:cell division protein FtsI (penicillin-binding protein 3)